MSTSLQRLPFDLHVLCAPPAFILSQDQTLLFVVFIFHSFERYKSKLKCFIKLLNFLLFLLNKKLLKNNFLVLILWLEELYRFGLFSKGFTVYFSMYFLFLFCVERFVLYYIIFPLSTFFLHFFKIFFKRFFLV